MRPCALVARARAMKGLVLGGFAVAALALHARAARADDARATAPKVEREADPKWSLSTGFGFGAVIGPGVIGSPGGYLLVERKLAGPLWAIGRFGVLYARSSYDMNDPSGYLTATSAWGIALGGGAGVRVVITSPKVLGFSLFGLVEGAYMFSVQEPSLYESRSSSVGGELGFSLDRELVKNFGIRVSTIVASARYGVARMVAPDSQGSPVEVTGHETDVALQLQPAVELRWSF